MTYPIPRRPRPFYDGKYWTWTRRDDDKELYELDLTELLPSGDSCSTISNKTSSGVTVDSIALSGDTLQVTISDGSGYLIAKVTTTNGYIFEVPLQWRTALGVKPDAWS